MVWRLMVSHENDRRLAYGRDHDVEIGAMRGDRGCLGIGALIQQVAAGGKQRLAENTKRLLITELSLSFT